MLLIRLQNFRFFGNLVFSSHTNTHAPSQRALLSTKLPKHLRILSLAGASLCLIELNVHMLLQFSPFDRLLASRIGSKLVVERHFDRRTSIALGGTGRMFDEMVSTFNGDR